MRRVTADSNILISALQFGGKPLTLLDMAQDLREITTHVIPAERIDVVAADPDDDRVLECAVAAASEVIVSGDTDLLRLGTFRGLPVMTVAAFLVRVQAQKL